MHDPRIPHLNALKRILRYLQGTLSHCSHLRPSSFSGLIAYSDADWAGCPDTRRSTSGYCVFLGFTCTPRLLLECCVDGRFYLLKVLTLLHMIWYSSVKWLKFTKNKNANSKRRGDGEEVVVAKVGANLRCGDGRRWSEMGEGVWRGEGGLQYFVTIYSLTYSLDFYKCFKLINYDIDSNEIATHLSQFEHININEEGSSNGDAPELMSPCVNEGKEVEFTSDKGTNTGNPLEKLVMNGFNNIADVIPPSRNTESEKYTVFSTKIAANEIKNINKNYFGSYSSFGIHRDMISDKVRTDAYRQAILENPLLLRGAVVMDVGCGTGILSLFAAQAGAARVIAVEASDKMAEVATQIAKENGLLQNRIPGEGGQRDGVIDVVHGMVEELRNTDYIQPHSVDVLISEWMGYCLLYESMLSSVLFARDRWLKPGGAIFPDTATMFVAGFGRGGTSIPFWENVYGFNMSCIGREVVEDAARIPIVDVIDSCNIITTTEVLQSFDLATMQRNEMDFTATVELEPKLDTPSGHSTCSKLEATWCYGIVLWFDTGFTKRFCREKPVNLSTSPYDPSTHWSQTILTFREPIAISSKLKGIGHDAMIGLGGCACVQVHIRSIHGSMEARVKHLSYPISKSPIAIGKFHPKRHWTLNFSTF
ncbi:hypothetical protein BUALT_Bualt01G0152700 [Buddleja alternifolia]|uniref:Uncharacterized protein n=1 Tax=Buddleja alternifolia TaxID=168488 RepID=A0AAV6YBH0_9LAMI|nr:hypothetical protein BUALT_Bualt01G0152700 [Buddleja alternifolia]